MGRAVGLSGTEKKGSGLGRDQAGLGERAVRDAGLGREGSWAGLGKGEGWADLG